MNDMRKLLSGALPAPEDEPPQRDVIGAAMEWGQRRRRREWTLTGAAALAVLAVGAAAAAMGGGSGGTASPGTGQRTPPPNGISASGSAPSEFDRPPNSPGGTWWTPSCTEPTSLQGKLADYCRLFNEEQNFSAAFARGSVQYLQAALPPGYSVKATDTYVVILTGPTGTNYLFPSVTGASTFSRHAPSCGSDSSCYQTSAGGGSVVVGSGPSGAQSAGWVKDDLKDPRITIAVGTVEFGGMNGIPAPTAHALLSDEQLAKLLSDPHLQDYAKTQYQHLADISTQLRVMAPPSGTTSYSASPPSFSLPSGDPSTENSSRSAPGTPTGAPHS